MEFKRVDIKTGYLCNNNCVFCVQAHNKRFANKNNEEIKISLRSAKKDGFQGVVFTGGEFTIREDSIELVAYAKQLGFSIIQIQTNGRMLSNVDYCKKMIKAGVNEFAPALHGPTAKIHNSLTRSSGSFQQTITGIKNLRKLNQYIIVNSVIVKLNYKYAPDIATLLCELGVNQFQFAFVHALGNAKTNISEMMPKKSEVIPYLKKGIDIAKKHGVFAMVEAVPFCFMQGYEKHVSELYIPQTRIEEQGRTIEDFSVEKIKSKAKIKFEKCKMCKYYEICEGPWKEYPAHHGIEEFKPILGEKIKSTNYILEN